MCYRSRPGSSGVRGRGLLVGAGVTDTPCGLRWHRRKWAEMMAQGLGLEDKNPQRRRLNMIFLNDE